MTIDWWNSSPAFTVDVANWKAELHPRDSHGRFRDSWRLGAKAMAAVDRILKHFNAAEFRSDKHAGSYLRRVKTKPRSQKQNESITRFYTPEGYDDITSSMWADYDRTKSGGPSADIKNIGDMMEPLPQDMLLTWVGNGEQFGLPPERMDEIEEWTGKLVSNKAFSATQLTTPDDLTGTTREGPHVTWSILAPRGTQAVVVGDGFRDVILDEEQPLQIMKVEKDGRGGMYVYATAMPKQGTGQVARNLGKELPASEKSPAVDATPDELAKRGLDADGNPIQKPLPPSGTPAPGEAGLPAHTPAPTAPAGPPGPSPAKAIQQEGGEVPLGAGKVVQPGEDIAPREKITPRETKQIVPEEQARIDAAQARLDERQAQIDQRDAESAERQARLADQQAKLIDQLLSREGGGTAAEAAPEAPEAAPAPKKRVVQRKPGSIEGMTEQQKNDVVARDKRFQGEIEGYPRHADEVRIHNQALQIQRERGEQSAPEEVAAPSAPAPRRTDEEKADILRRDEEASKNPNYPMDQEEQKLQREAADIRSGEAGVEKAAKKAAPKPAAKIAKAQAKAAAPSAAAKSAAKRLEELPEIEGQEGALLRGASQEVLEGDSVTAVRKRLDDRASSLRIRAEAPSFEDDPAERARMLRSADQYEAASKALGARGPAAGKISAADLKDGDKVLITQTDDGRWVPATKRTGAKSVRITSVETSRARGRDRISISGTDDNGDVFEISAARNTANQKGMTPSQRLLVPTEKRPTIKRAAAKKAAPETEAPEAEAPAPAKKAAAKALRAPAKKATAAEAPEVAAARERLESRSAAKKGAKAAVDPEAQSAAAAGRKLSADKDLDLDDPYEADLHRAIRVWVEGEGSFEDRQTLYRQIAEAEANPTTPGARLARAIASAPGSKTRLYRGMTVQSGSFDFKPGDDFDMGPSSVTKSTSLANMFSGGGHANEDEVTLVMGAGTHALSVPGKYGYRGTPELLASGRFKVKSVKKTPKTRKGLFGGQHDYHEIKIELEPVEDDGLVIRPKWTAVPPSRETVDLAAKLGKQAKNRDLKVLLDDLSAEDGEIDPGVALALLRTHRGEWTQDATLVDQLISHLERATKVAPAKKATPAKAVAARLTPAERAVQRRVDIKAARLHEDWRKTQELLPDGTRKPKFKKTDDQTWIDAHGGSDQVDIANSSYEDLPDDWQKENREAAKVVDSILERRGNKIDLTDEKTRQEVGEEIHAAWLSRHGDEKWEGEDGPTVREGELGKPFAELSEKEQDKDIDQVYVAMGRTPPVKKAAPAKAAPPVVKTAKSAPNVVPEGDVETRMIQRSKERGEQRKTDLDTLDRAQTSTRAGDEIISTAKKDVSSERDRDKVIARLRTRATDLRENGLALGDLDGQDEHSDSELRQIGLREAQELDDIADELEANGPKKATPLKAAPAAPAKATPAPAAEATPEPAKAVPAGAFRTRLTNQMRELRISADKTRSLLDRAKRNNNEKLEAKHQETIDRLHGEALDIEDRLFPDGLHRLSGRELTRIAKEEDAWPGYSVPPRFLIDDIRAKRGTPGATKSVPAKKAAPEAPETDIQRARRERAERRQAEAAKPETERHKANREEGQRQAEVGNARAQAARDADDARANAVLDEAGVKDSDLSEMERAKFRVTEQQLASRRISKVAAARRLSEDPDSPLAKVGALWSRPAAKKAVPEAAAPEAPEAAPTRVDNPAELGGEGPYGPASWTVTQRSKPAGADVAADPDDIKLGTWVYNPNGNGWARITKGPTKKHGQETYDVLFARTDSGSPGRYTNSYNASQVREWIDSYAKAKGYADKRDAAGATDGGWTPGHGPQSKKAVPSVPAAPAKKAAPAAAPEPREELPREISRQTDRRAYARKYEKMSKEDFEKLPESERETILDNLRKVASIEDTTTIQDSMRSTVRGVRAPHRDIASNAVKRFTAPDRPAPEVLTPKQVADKILEVDPKDKDHDSKVRRLLRGERAKARSKAEMQDIGRYVSDRELGDHLSVDKIEARILEGSRNRGKVAEPEAPAAPVRRAVGRKPATRTDQVRFDDFPEPAKELIRARVAEIADEAPNHSIPAAWRDAMNEFLSPISADKIAVDTDDPNVKYEIRKRPGQTGYHVVRTTKGSTIAESVGGAYSTHGAARKAAEAEVKKGVPEPEVPAATSAVPSKRGKASEVFVGDTIVQRKRSLAPSRPGAHRATLGPEDVVETKVAEVQNRGGRYVFFDKDGQQIKSGTAGTVLEFRETGPRETKKTAPAIEKAAGTAEGKLTASRLQPGVRVLLEQGNDGSWRPTTRKTNVTPFEVVRTAPTTRNRSVGLVLKDDDGNEITIHPGASQTFIVEPEGGVKSTGDRSEFKALGDKFRRVQESVEAPGKEKQYSDRFKTMLERGTSVGAVRAAIRLEERRNRESADRYRPDVARGNTSAFVEERDASADYYQRLGAKFDEVMKAEKPAKKAAPAKAAKATKALPASDVDARLKALGLPTSRRELEAASSEKIPGSARMNAAEYKAAFLERAEAGTRTGTPEAAPIFKAPAVKAAVKKAVKAVTPASAAGNGPMKRAEARRIARGLRHQRSEAGAARLVRDLDRDELDAVARQMGVPHSQMVRDGELRSDIVDKAMIDRDVITRDAKLPPRVERLPEETRLEQAKSLGLSGTERDRFVESGMRPGDWKLAKKADSKLVRPRPTPNDPQSEWGQNRDLPVYAWIQRQGRPGFLDQVDRVYTARDRDEARQYLWTRDDEQLRLIGVASGADLGGTRDRGEYIDRIIDGIREPEAGTAAKKATPAAPSAPAAAKKARPPRTRAMRDDLSPAEVDDRLKALGLPTDRKELEDASSGKIPGQGGMTDEHYKAAFLRRFEQGVGGGDQEPAPKFAPPSAARPTITRTPKGPIKDPAARARAWGRENGYRGLQGGWIAGPADDKDPGVQGWNKFYEKYKTRIDKWETDRLRAQDAELQAKQNPARAVIGGHLVTPRVRKALLEKKTEKERADYLDSLEFKNVTEARRLAKDLGVKGLDRSTVDQVKEGINKHFAPAAPEPRLAKKAAPAVKKAVPAKKAAPTQAELDFVPSTPGLSLKDEHWLMRQHEENPDGGEELRDIDPIPPQLRKLGLVKTRVRGGKRQSILTDDGKAALARAIPSQKARMEKHHKEADARTAKERAEVKADQEAKALVADGVVNPTNLRQALVDAHGPAARQRVLDSVEKFIRHDQERKGDRAQFRPIPDARWREIAGPKGLGLKGLARSDKKAIHAAILEHFADVDAARKADLKAKKVEVRDRTQESGLGRQLLDEAGADPHHVRRFAGDRDDFTSDRGGDLIGEKMAAKQGFDALPEVLTRDEFEARRKDMGLVLYRGINTAGREGDLFNDGFKGKPASEVHDEFREGRYHMGNGVFGNGTYMTRNKQHATGYSDLTEGSIGRYGLAKDAKIVELPDLIEEHQAYRAGLEKDSPEDRTLGSDLGVYAMARGYDAIHVPRGSVALGTGPDGAKDQYVILNRGKVFAEAPGDKRTVAQARRDIAAAKKRDNSTEAQLERVLPKKETPAEKVAPKPAVAAPERVFDLDAMTDGQKDFTPRDKARLEGYQKQLDEGASPRDIARDIDGYVNGAASPFYRAGIMRQLGEDRDSRLIPHPPEYWAQRDREEAALVAEGRRWADLRDKLKVMKRPAKRTSPAAAAPEGAPSTSKADIEKNIREVNDEFVATRTKSLDHTEEKLDKLDQPSSILTADEKRSSIKQLQDAAEQDRESAARMEDFPKEKKRFLDLADRADALRARFESKLDINEKLTKDKRERRASYVERTDAALDALQKRHGDHKLTAEVIQDLRDNDWVLVDQTGPGMYLFEPRNGNGPGLNVHLPAKEDGRVSFLTPRGKITYKAVREYVAEHGTRKPDVTPDVTPTKATRPTITRATGAKPDPAEVMASLQSFENPPTREASAELLKPFNRTELEAMARDINFPGAGRATRVELIDGIISGTSGRRRDSIATRGFRGLRPDSPDLVDDGLDSMVLSDLRDLAAEHEIPGYNSLGDSRLIQELRKKKAVAPKKTAKPTAANLQARETQRARQSLLNNDDRKLDQADVQAEMDRLEAQDAADQRRLAGRPGPAERLASDSVKLTRDPEGDGGIMHGDSPSMELARRLSHRGRNGSANKVMDMRAAYSGPPGSSDPGATQKAVDELRLMRLEEQDPAIRELYDEALSKMDAPEQPVPDLPKDTPPGVRRLIEDLNKIPLARRRESVQDSDERKSAVEQLAEAIREISDGEPRASDKFRSILRRYHESRDGAYSMWKLDPEAGNNEALSKEIRTWRMEAYRRHQAGGAPTLPRQSPEDTKTEPYGPGSISKQLDKATTREEADRILKPLSVGELDDVARHRDIPLDRSGGSVTADARRARLVGDIADDLGLDGSEHKAEADARLKLREAERNAQVAEMITTIDRLRADGASPQAMKHTITSLFSRYNDSNDLKPLVDAASTLDNDKIDAAIRDARKKHGIKAPEPAKTKAAVPTGAPATKLTPADQARVRRLIRQDPQIFATAQERFGRVSTSGNLSEEDANWLQGVYERERPFVEHAAQEAQIRRRLDKEAKAAGDTPAAYRAKVAAQLKEKFADKPIAVRVRDEAALDGILTGGRFKTQFDEGTRRAPGLTTGVKQRRTGEEVLGTAPDTSPEKRPVYGYVAVSGIEPALSEGRKVSGVHQRDGQEDVLSSYGKVQVVLKPDVRARTTASVGDSLDELTFVRPSAVDNPSADSLGLSKLDEIGKGDWTRTHYVEAQIHGGVTKDDIAEVVFPSEPSPAIAKKLDNAGIPYRVLPAKKATPTVEAKDVTEALKSANERDLVQARIDNYAEKVDTPAARKMAENHRKGLLTPEDVDDFIARDQKRRDRIAEAQKGSIPGSEAKTGDTARWVPLTDEEPVRGTVVRRGDNMYVDWENGRREKVTENERDTYFYRASAPTATERAAAGYPDVPRGVDTSEDEWRDLSYSERLQRIVAARSKKSDNDGPVVVRPAQPRTGDRELPPRPAVEKADVPSESQLVEPTSSSVDNARKRLAAREAGGRRQRAGGSAQLAQELEQIIDARRNDRNQSAFRAAIAEKLAQAPTGDVGNERDHNTQGYEDLRKLLRTNDQDTAAKFQTRLRKHLESRGITVEGNSGDQVAYDPDKHDLLDGASIQPGELAEIHSPGMTYEDRKATVAPVAGVVADPKKWKAGDGVPTSYFLDAERKLGKGHTNDLNELDRSVRTEDQHYKVPDAYKKLDAALAKAGIGRDEPPRKQLREWFESTFKENKGGTPEVPESTRVTLQRPVLRSIRGGGDGDLSSRPTPTPDEPFADVETRRSVLGDKRDAGIDLLFDFKGTDGTPFRTPRGLDRVDRLTRKLRPSELQSMADALHLEGTKGDKFDALRNKVMKDIRRRLGLPEPYGQERREQLESKSMRELIDELPPGMKKPSSIRKPELIDMIIGDGPVEDFHVGSENDRGIQALKEAFDGGLTDRSYVSNGSMGQVARVEGPDGKKMIRKRMSSDWFMSGEQQTDAEQTMSELGRRIGAPQAAVYRPTARTVFMDEIPGKHAEMHEPEEIAAAVRTPEGRRMAILDAITGNSDRHNNNWMIVDGKPVGFDNSLAFSEDAKYGPDGEILPDGLHTEDPFKDAFPYRTVEIDSKTMGIPLVSGGDWLDKNQFTTAELADVRRELEAMKPQFERLDRKKWYDAAHARLDALTKRASDAPGNGGPSPQVAKKAAPSVAKKASAPNAVAAAARLREVGTEREAIEALASDKSLTSHKLRQVADELGIDIPDDVKAKSQLQLHIAERVAKDRNLPYDDGLPAIQVDVKKAAPKAPRGVPEGPAVAAARQRLEAREAGEKAKLTKAMNADQKAELRTLTPEQKEKYWDERLAGSRVDHDTAVMRATPEPAPKFQGPTPRLTDPKTLKDLTPKSFGDEGQIDLREAHPELRRAITDAFDMDSDGISFKVDEDVSSVYEDADGNMVIKAEGYMRDKDGNIVGSFRRVLTPATGTVHNDSFGLDDSIQKRGLATRFNDQQDQKLADMGFTRLTISPAMNGGLASARRDFRWRTDRAGRAGDVPTRIGAAYERATPEEREVLTGWLDRFADQDIKKWPTPKEISDQGSLGRSIMNGSSWSGEKSLHSTPRPKISTEPPRSRVGRRAPATESAESGRPAITGKLGGDRQVHHILAEDTWPQGVNVRSLTLPTDYTIGEGTAWRRNGVTYLVEHGSSHEERDRATLAVMALIAHQRTLPAGASRYQRSYTMVSRDNPADKYWEERYGLAEGLRSAMSAAGGDTIIWRDGVDSANDMDNSLNHEFGHNVDTQAPAYGSQSQAWKKAVAARDPNSKVRNFEPLPEGEFTANFPRGEFDRGVTPYGTASPIEDYAESIRLYMLGVLGTGQLTDGSGWSGAVYFRDLFPADAAVLDKLFPEEAARQLAEIAKLRGR